MDIDSLIRKYSDDLVKSDVLSRLEPARKGLFILVSEANAITGDEIDSLLEIGFKIAGVISKGNKTIAFFKLN